LAERGTFFAVPLKIRAMVFFCLIFTQARGIVVANLTPGNTYSVQARGVGGSMGYSDWSDPGLAHGNVKAGLALRAGRGAVRRPRPTKFVVVSVETKKPALIERAVQNFNRFTF
jgi:hypothetical protein